MLPIQTQLLTPTSFDRLVYVFSRGVFALIGTTVLSSSVLAAKPTPPSLHPQAARLEIPMGPFIRLKNGDILTVDETSALLSSDEGKTWQPHPLFANGQDIAIRKERVLLETRDGTVILAFVNDKERNWKWDKALSDSPEARLPTYTIRSLDGGKTWLEPQKLHDDWTGAIRDIIQTRDGNVVLTSMMMLHHPGRHATVTYSSADEGQTWHRSNLIDLGGKGHHDGALEATLEQLKDGRIRMLLRTNFGVFWEAISTDNGRYWRTLQPTTLDASSAPGLLKRVKSGRLILVWNRLLPEGKTEFPKVGGDGQWSETPTINHRSELSVAFSSDEGKTWSKPVVVATAPDGKARDVSYPFLFEIKPGTFWLTTMRGGLAATFKEDDFLIE